MSWLGSWIYWLQFIGICVAAAVAFLIAVRILGWDRVKGFLLPLLGILAVFGLRAKIQQAAYQDRVVEEDQANDQIRDDFKEIHKRNEGLTDDELDKKNDPWLKP